MGATGILERLKQGVVLGDGGYLLELEKRGHVQAGPFTPEVTLENPEALRQLHLEFLKAGAEVLQALTFYASADKLATVGLADKVEEINRNAVRIARAAAGESEALVAGNLSLTWAYDPNDAASADHVRAILDEQIRVQLEEGVDFFIGETFTFLGEALLALERARKAGLPVMITMAFEKAPHSYEGHGAAECARRLADAGADIVGMNCLRNPTHLLPFMAEIRAAVSIPIACQPTAYRTPADQPDFTSLAAFPGELEPLQLSRAEMADYAVKAREMGVNYIGSCCGSVASHVREMARALGKLTAAERKWRVDYRKPMSAYEYYRHGEPPES
jgi:betaine-homocysteine S-methyltransferase